MHGQPRSSLCSITGLHTGLVRLPYTHAAALIVRRLNSMGLPWAAFVMHTCRSDTAHCVLAQSPVTHKLLLGLALLLFFFALSCV